jgi:hypothetical protein
VPPEAEPAARAPVHGSAGPHPLVGETR